MREIKFRAWDTVSKSMLHDVSTGTIAIWDSKTNKEAKAKDCDFMQFTGLHDKHGKEIYEGDVVKAGNHHASEIVFKDASFILAHHHCEQPIGYLREKIPLEVIGNIYEKPELLS